MIKPSLAGTGILIFALLAPPTASSQNWPEGQVLPRFSVYTSLEVADISGFPFDRKVAFTVLQGIVNRSLPRIYLLDAQQSGEGKNFWINRMTVTKTTLANPMTLFTKYRSAISGICIYDPSLMGTVNVAVTASGVTDCIVASPALAATLSVAPYNIPVTLDLRTLGFTDNRAAFAWAKAQYWSRCTHRMLTGMSPGIHYPLFDYIVANRALCIWLDPGVTEDIPLLDAIFSDMPVNGVYLGWWAGETRGVAYASGHGVITFAADWFANATVTSGGSATLINLPPLATPPPISNKCFIALILSDGDNLQEQEHLFPIRWANTLRGTFPVSWTQSPALADFAPDQLNYFYATQTPKDCFITGPSGVGYVLPENMSRANFSAFARLSEVYLKKTAMRVATPWGNTSWASDSFGIHCPTLLGLANKQGGGAPKGLHYWARGIASVEMAPDYASFASQIIPEINSRMTAWNRSQPLFMAPQLNANVSGLDEMKLVYDAFKNNPEVVFVRADQLFQLMKIGTPTKVSSPELVGPRIKPGLSYRSGLPVTYRSGLPVTLTGRISRPLQGHSDPKLPH
jgi:hypothetical protein